MAGRAPARSVFPFHLFLSTPMTYLRRSSLALLVTIALAPTAAAAQQVRTLPAPDATFAEPFSQVGAANVRELRNGRVIVADPRDKILQMIDLASGSSTKIGREGSGPAEFGLPLRLFAAPGDTTLVFDPGNSRYLVVAPDGKPVHTFRLESPPAANTGGGMRMGGMSIARAADAQGRLYHEGSGFAMGPDGPTTSDSAPILRYDRARQKSDTIGMVKLARNNVQTSGGQGNMRVMIGGSNPLAARDEWTVFPDGRVAIVRASDYHVDWVMPDGAQRSSAPIRYSPIRMTAADIKEEEALRITARASQMSMTMTNDNGNQRSSVSMGAPAGAPPPPPITDWPEVKPPFRPNFQSVWARSNGELWVRRTEPAGAKGTLYDVINAQGAVTHQVRVPEGLTVVGMGNGTVYTTKLDEDDLQYLQRHRM